MPLKLDFDGPTGTPNWLTPAGKKSRQTLPPLNARQKARLRAQHQQRLRTAGGDGSGNFGHAGRPGEVGGSAIEGQTGPVRRYVPQSPGAARDLILAATGVGRVFVSNETLALRSSVEVAQTLKEMKARGYTMPDMITISMVTGESPSGETAIVYDQTELLINLPENAPDNMPLDDIVLKAFGGGHDSTPRFTVKSFKDVVVHEMGHVQHGMGTEGHTQQSFATIDRKSKWIDAAAKQVSHYAAKNTNEFVAEAFTLQYNGGQLKPEAAELYKLLDGPVVH